MGDFKKLRAWQAARSLVVLSVKATAQLPPGERFLLGDQWKRAAYSVALNLAEGSSRRGPREFRRYLDQARASLHELEAILDLVRGLGYLDDGALSSVESTRADCARMVYGLLRKMSEASTRTR